MGGYTVWGKLSLWVSLDLGNTLLPEKSVEKQIPSPCAILVYDSESEFLTSILM
jgi:hypothetical protein